MGPQQDHIAVTGEELRAVSADIEATADAAARDVDLIDCDTSVFDKNATRWQELVGKLADRGNEVEAAARRLDA